LHLKTKNVKVFENYPPLTDNRLTKAFKNNHPDLKITTVKEYMGVIFFEKTKEATVAFGKSHKKELNI